MPTVDENRLTASLSYTKPFNAGDLWATTLAWGRKYDTPGNTLDGNLAESELIFKNGITLFTRAERVQNDELLERDEMVMGPVTLQPVYTVSKVSVGGIYDFVHTQNMKFGLGAFVSRYGIPDALKSDYGDPTSYTIFARLKIQSGRPSAPLTPPLANARCSAALVCDHRRDPPSRHVRPRRWTPAISCRSARTGRRRRPSS